MQKEACKAEFTCLEKGKDISRNSPLRKLNPVLTDLLRVGGRLVHFTLQEVEKYPLIIPGCSHIVSLLVNLCHDRFKHRGLVFTEAAVPSARIWIVGAKRCVNNILPKCVTCHKLEREQQKQSKKISHLPSDLFSVEPPFTNIVWMHTNQA